MELVSDHGDDRLHKRYGGGDGREENKQEEQRADHAAYRTHGVKYLGQCDEHKTGTRVDSVGGAAVEGDDRGDYDKTRKKRYAGVENLNLANALFDVVIFLHV